MFDEMNVHAQCRHCNRFQEGNHFLYRKWLAGKYGEAAVKELEARAQMGGGYSTSDLLMLADVYRDKLKELKKERQNAALFQGEGK
jgi:hypothetical protein